MRLLPWAALHRDRKHQLWMMTIAQLSSYYTSSMKHLVQDTEEHQPAKPETSLSLH